MNKAQSMINNLKSVSGNRYSAEKALEKLALAKETTGLSEQRVLINMVLYAFENDPRYKTERNMVINKTEPSEKAKQCLTSLRSIRGQSEQSLLSEMVQYAFEHDPQYGKKK